MSDYQLILTTLPDTEKAEQLAEQLLNGQLAACINILPQMTSMYRWQGKLEQGREHLLMIKTRTARVDEIIETIRATHPYELPEIIALPIMAGLPGYLQWIDECTS